MGKGNFINKDGHVIYVDLQVDELVQELIKEEDNIKTEEELYSDYGNVLYADLLENIDHILNTKKQIFEKVSDTDYSNNISYKFENSHLKIGFADNDSNIALCLTPKKKDNGKPDKRAYPTMYRLLKGLLQIYDLYLRDTAWTSSKVNAAEDLPIW